MDFKRWMSKLGWKNGGDKWLILLAIGLILMILAFPTGNEKGFPGTGKMGGSKAGSGVGMLNGAESEETAEASVKPAKTYEQELELRVKEILSHVDGVGKVDVMIVLKSSEEKVLRVDKSTSVSSTRETDQSGGSRSIDSQELAEDTILTGNGDSGAPIVEKELKPQIAGVVISAEGGGSQKVKAEISEAMEALFDIPTHKIKVLKRVE